MAKFTLYTNIRFALACAILDLKKDIKNTVLGPIWRSIGLGVVIVLLWTLFGAILKGNISDTYRYLVSLTAGLIFWDFLSNCVIGSTLLYLGPAQSLRYSPQPREAMFIKVWLRSLVRFSINAAIAVGLGAVFLPSIVIPNISIIPAFILVAAFVFSMCWLFGILSIRFGGIHQSAAWMMNVWFLLTPIIWPPNFLGRYEALHLLNPAFHFIAQLNEGLSLDERAWLFHWLASLGMTATILVICYVLTRRADRSIEYHP